MQPRCMSVDGIESLINDLLLSLSSIEEANLLCVDNESLMCSAEVTLESGLLSDEFGEGRHDEVHENAREDVVRDNDDRTLDSDGLDELASEENDIKGRFENVGVQIGDGSRELVNIFCNALVTVKSKRKKKRNEKSFVGKTKDTKRTNMLSILSSPC